MIVVLKAKEKARLALTEDRRILWACVSLAEDGEFTLTLNGVEQEHLFLKGGVPHTWWSNAGQPLIRSAQLEFGLVKKDDGVEIWSSSDGALRIEFNE